MVGLEVNALVRDCKHPVNFNQWQDSLDLELALKLELLGKTFDACFVEPDLRVNACALVVECLDVQRNHFFDFASNFVVESIACLALTVECGQCVIQSVKLPVLKADLQSVLLHFILFAELVHLVRLRCTLARNLNQLGHC